MKKKIGLRPFFRNFTVGREGFFDLEVLMLKYNKIYPYLLSLLHPSVQVYPYTDNKPHRV